MSYNKETKLLKDLVDIPSPSGFERPLSEHIKKELLKYLPRTRVEIDFHNNVIATIKGKTDKVVVIDAHLDQLGFLVNNIDKEGYISLIAIGGHDTSLLRGRKVSILTTHNKIIKGVIGTKPIHLIDDEADELPDRTSDVTLDVGIRKRKQVSALISIGDPVVLSPEFDRLIDGYYTGSGFDDKAGCFILMETVKTIIRKRLKPSPTLKFVFTSQEEVGCKGAKEMAYRFKPDLFIGVDVTFATDQSDVDERRTGRCLLEKGLAIYKGINIHRKSVDLLGYIAKNKKIKVQYLATSDSGGTNAKSVANTNGGIKIVDLGIPLRNMHSNVEIINMKDLKNGTRLLTEFLCDRRLNGILEK